MKEKERREKEGQTQETEPLLMLELKVMEYIVQKNQ